MQIIPFKATKKPEDFFYLENDGSIKWKQDILKYENGEWEIDMDDDYIKGTFDFLIQKMIENTGFEKIALITPDGKIISLPTKKKLSEILEDMGYKEMQGNISYYTKFNPGEKIPDSDTDYIENSEKDEGEFIINFLFPVNGFINEENVHIYASSILSEYSANKYIDHEIDIFENVNIKKI